jgi:hypothetical protein
MTNEAEKNPKQEKPQPGGSVNSPDKKTDPSQESQSETSPQDISRKNPSQDSDTQHKGQQKPEDEKRRAS